MRQAISVIDRYVGLMFDNTPDQELEIVLPDLVSNGPSIHTFFMRYPIKVLWMDENHEVLYNTFVYPWVANVKPNIPPGRKVKYIQEWRMDQP